MVVQVRTSVGVKILPVEPAMYSFLNKKFAKEDVTRAGDVKEEVDEGAGGDFKKDDERKLEVFFCLVCFSRVFVVRSTFACIL